MRFASFRDHYEHSDVPSKAQAGAEASRERRSGPKGRRIASARSHRSGSGTERSSPSCGRWSGAAVSTRRHDVKKCRLGGLSAKSDRCSKRAQQRASAEEPGGCGRVMFFCDGRRERERERREKKNGDDDDFTLNFCCPFNSLALSLSFPFENLDGLLESLLMLSSSSSSTPSLAARRGGGGVGGVASTRQGSAAAAVQRASAAAPTRRCRSSVATPAAASSESSGRLQVREQCFFFVFYSQLVRMNMMLS